MHGSVVEKNNDESANGDNDDKMPGIVELKSIFADGYFEGDVDSQLRWPLKFCCI